MRSFSSSGRAFRCGVLSATFLVFSACGSEAPSEDSSETAPVAAVAARAGPSLEEVGCDAARANAVFNQCKVCHSAEAGAANLTGPNLYGVVGRPAASTDGFAYSPVLRNSGITWDEQTLDEFLASPLTYLPNNRMAFGGVTNEADRSAVVCLLTTLR